MCKYLLELIIENYSYAITDYQEYIKTMCKYVSNAIRRKQYKCIFMVASWFSHYGHNDNALFYAVIAIDMIRINDELVRKNVAYYFSDPKLLLEIEKHYDNKLKSLN